MSSLNKALSELPDTHVSFFYFQLIYYFEFLLFHLSFIHGEYDHVSYMTDKSSFSIRNLKDCLGYLYVLLTVQGYITSSDYYPDSIIILYEYYLCLPSRIEFLVTLVIRWRIYFLPYHSMVPSQYFLMTKT